MPYNHKPPIAKYAFFRHGQFMESQITTWAQAKAYAQRNGMVFRRDDETTLSNEQFEERGKNQIKFGVARYGFY